jgi:hypothetical protein
MERLSLHTLDACLHYDLHHDLAPCHHYGLNPLTSWSIHTLHQANTYQIIKDKVPPHISLRAKLSHHSSLQSVLGILGQGKVVTRTITDGWTDERTDGRTVGWSDYGRRVVRDLDAL